MRALLCIPHGGLNDTLCQIEKCRRYAAAHDRALIIDTYSKSGLLGHFSDFFEAATDWGAPVTFRLDEKCRGRLNEITAAPAFVSGRLGAYASLFSHEKNIHEATSGCSITFAFDQDHEESLLVHEQCGGGSLSTELLPRVALTEPVRRAINEALRRLPASYVGVHVRNTDLQTDYRTFFETIHDETIGRDMLVASDDAGAIAFARTFFGAARVFTATATPDVQRKPLHTRGLYADDGQRVQATVAALTDLIALGRAEALYYEKRIQNAPANGLARNSGAGFSRLANHLATNKELIGSLLGC